VLAAGSTPFGPTPGFEGVDPELGIRPHDGRPLPAPREVLVTSLASGGRPVHSLAEELRALSDYVEIMRARYGERLSVEMRADPGTESAEVPVFLLQPLVENAILHGADRRAGAARIEVFANRAGGELRLGVRDDGPGIPGDPEAAIGRGIGLMNTRARLHHIHGDDASLRLVNVEQGGLLAEARLPFRVAERMDEPQPAEAAR